MLDNGIFQARVICPVPDQAMKKIGSALKYLNESADTFYQISQLKS